MPQKVPQGSHKCSHITRKRGIFCYRRRLPGVADGELCISLRTRRFREAEHRAAIMDGVFNEALCRAKTNVTDDDDLNRILRGYLREFLDSDLERRMERPPGSPVYAWWWEPGDPDTSIDADLQAIRQARDSLARDLAENSPKEMEEVAERLIRKHGLSENLLRPLTYGLIEAVIQGWEVAERRTLGTAPLIFPSWPRRPRPTWRKVRRQLSKPRRWRRVWSMHLGTGAVSREGGLPEGPPAKEYKPTREEVAAVELLAARKKARPPAPKLKFTKNGKVVSVDQDHPKSRYRLAYPPQRDGYRK